MPVAVPPGRRGWLTCSPAQFPWAPDGKAKGAPWSEPSSNQNSLLERDPQVVAERSAAGFEVGFSRCKRERLTTKLANADERRRPADGSSAHDWHKVPVGSRFGLHCAVQK